MSYPKFIPTRPIEGDKNNKYMYFHRLEEEVPYEKADEEVELGYENYNASDCLKIMMSKHDIPEKDIPSGFEVIGDVAHLNLLDSTFPHRFEIG